MARPRLDDSLLKNPRRVRASPTTGQRIKGLPEPTPAEIKRWKPLVDACTRLVMTNDRVCNRAKKAKIRLWLPTRWNINSELPPCKCDGANKLTSINAELVLLWLWSHKLAKYSPTMLYAARRKHLSSLTAMENELLLEITLDTEQILAHNVDYILEET